MESLIKNQDDAPYGIEILSEDQSRSFRGHIRPSWPGIQEINSRTSVTCLGGRFEDHWRQMLCLSDPDLYVCVGKVNITLQLVNWMHKTPANNWYFMWNLTSGIVFCSFEFLLRWQIAWPCQSVPMRSYKPNVWMMTLNQHSLSECWGVLCQLLGQQQEPGPVTQYSSTQSRWSCVLSVRTAWASGWDGLRIGSPENISKKGEHSNFVPTTTY